MKQPTPITLFNDVVTLIPMTMERVEDFYQAGKPESIWRWTPPYQCVDRDTAKNWVAQGIAATKRGEQVMFGIIDNASGQFVGSTRYLDIDTIHSGIEIGYTFVNPQFQRTHINSHCKLLLLTHAFEELGAQRVQLRTHQRNQKSRNAISRLGCQFEGILRHHRLLSTGEYRNTALFSLLADEWEAVKDRLVSKIAGHQIAHNKPSVVIESDVVDLINEFPLAQVIIASNDNLMQQIIYVPMQLDAARQCLTGHVSLNNKLVWLLENGPKVTVMFQGGDAYIAPSVHSRQLVPTWNYRRVHVGGQFAFLPLKDNRKQVQRQVAQFEEEWSIEQQSSTLMDKMLAHIRCFEITIEAIVTDFKVSKNKPSALKEAIADELVSSGQLSLAKAHFNGVGD